MVELRSMICYSASGSVLDDKYGAFIQLSAVIGPLQCVPRLSLRYSRLSAGLHAKESPRAAIYSLKVRCATHLKKSCFGERLLWRSSWCSRT